MIQGNKSAIDRVMDLSALGIAFKSRPTVFGGLAMEYYGLRKHGEDIDLFVSNEDYQNLARKYPDCKKDRWGDLGLLIGKYEVWRSVARLDYAFYSDGAIEYEHYKVLSFEKLFFMKAIAYENEPEIPKHADDFRLAINHCYELFRNKEYVAYGMKHTQSYLAAPQGIVYNDRY